MATIIQSRLKIALPVAAGVIVLDQISKVIVRKNIDGGEVYNYLGDIFSILHVENTGAFLSLGDALSGPLRIILLSILPLLMLGYVFYYLLTHKELTTGLIIGLSLVTGGGVGNIIDRIAFGSVTDFFYLDFGVIRTGIFNIADLAVTGGAITILLNGLIRKKQPID